MLGFLIILAVYFFVPSRAQAVTCISQSHQPTCDNVLSQTDLSCTNNVSKVYVGECSPPVAGASLQQVRYCKCNYSAKDYYCDNQHFWVYAPENSYVLVDEVNQCNPQSYETYSSCTDSDEACDVCCRDGWTPVTIPTPTLTPTPTPVCDSACGQGVCGMRYWNNVCVAVYNDDLGCCHQACVPPVGGLCQWVVGAGGFGCNACMPTSTPATTPGATGTPTPTPPGGATVTPIPTGVCDSFSSVRRFTYNTTINPWWQTVDGDVHAEGNIASLIPSCAVEDYLSLEGSGGMPGVVSYFVSLTTGFGNVSETGWQAETAAGVVVEMGYDYLFNKFNVDTSNTLPGNDLSKIAEDGIYYWDKSDGYLTGGNVGDKKIIIFVTGDVTVFSDITVDNGGFFALIGKGSISFGVNVGEAHGFYLADGALTVKKKAAGTDKQFTGEGSFIGRGGVSLPRDINDNCSPAETFVARPDLYINAPAEFQYSPSFFQEVAP